jgi:hypothetical protein
VALLDGEVRDNVDLTSELGIAVFVKVPSNTVRECSALAVPHGEERDVFTPRVRLSVVLPSGTDELIAVLIKLMTIVDEAPRAL